MNLTESITFQLTTADSFGDDTVSTEYVTEAGVEPASAFTRGLNAELDTGGLVAWIAPDSDVWQDRRLSMTGMLAVFEGLTYRVTGVRPGRSLITDEEDLIELTLVKSDADGE